MIRRFFAFAIVIFLAGTVSVKAQSATATQAGTEVLQLKESGYDFGKIPQGRPVTHIFEIVNTGKTPLLLTNVQASCGCTTPEWSKAPIKPGATAQIKVGYNSAAEGYFNKSITILYNNNQSKTLLISGTVYKTPVTAAPVNASIALLKNINGH
ncbi:DUF1573 domain-containing protein [Pseudoflavitalea rhizosphaerae]|uniref:DUF1573 domain-containing protein n=1 Tax=Pseudoflavitalea rhizosphaerae TaxID=1884793 RepID=UPI000F8CA2EC|nr:DUF1573 domain-containing protein [Pseudoflavitalea rhizosphaerae]